MTQLVFSMTVGCRTRIMKRDAARSLPKIMNIQECAQPGPFLADQEGCQGDGSACAGVPNGGREASRVSRVHPPRVLAADYRPLSRQTNKGDLPKKDQSLKHRMALKMAVPLASMSEAQGTYRCKFYGT